jgi:hypothetical protein
MAGLTEESMREAVEEDSRLTFFSELLKDAGISSPGDRLDLIGHLRGKRHRFLVETAETAVTSKASDDFTTAAGE